MSESTQLFISELIRAAAKVEKLTKQERARLLRRAASTICDLRDEINYSEMPANNNGAGDMIHDLKQTAQSIEDFSAKDIGQQMLSAVGTINAALMLLDEKRKIERER